jgi:hypothetical protein
MTRAFRKRESTDKDGIIQSRKSGVFQVLNGSMFLNIVLR